MEKYGCLERFSNLASEGLHRCNNINIRNRTPHFGGRAGPEKTCEVQLHTIYRDLERKDREKENMQHLQETEEEEEETTSRRKKRRRIEGGAKAWAALEVQQCPYTAMELFEL